MSKILFTLFLFTSSSVSSQDRDLCNIKFWTYGDSIKYYVFSDKQMKSIKKIHRIKKMDSLYEYYISGNLKGKGRIELDKKEFSIDYSSKTKDTCYTYSYEGDWIVYYDDSIQRVAQTGRMKNQNKIGKWTTYSYNGMKTRIVDYGYDGYTVTLFDSLNKELSKREYIYNFQGDSMLVEDSENQDKNKLELSKFLYSNSNAVIMIFLFLLFIRLPINHFIFELEENREITMFWFPWMSSEKHSESFYYNLRSVSKFWWFNYNVKHKWLVFLSHFFSVLFILFVILMIIAESIR